MFSVAVLGERSRRTMAAADSPTAKGNWGCVWIRVILSKSPFPLIIILIINNYLISLVLVMFWEMFLRFQVVRLLNIVLALFSLVTGRLSLMKFCDLINNLNIKYWLGGKTKDWVYFRQNLGSYNIPSCQFIFILVRTETLLLLFYKLENLTFNTPISEILLTISPVNIFFP